jgi:hypothetical protein
VDPAVKVLLRRYVAGLYYSKSRGWTTNVDEALDFKERESAWSTANELGVGQLELLIVNDDGRVLSGVKFEDVRP